MLFTQQSPESIATFEKCAHINGARKVFFLWCNVMELDLTSFIRERVEMKQNLKHVRLVVHISSLPFLNRGLASPALKELD